MRLVIGQRHIGAVECDGRGRGEGQRDGSSHLRHTPCQVQLFGLSLGIQRHRPVQLQGLGFDRQRIYPHPAVRPPLAFQAECRVNAKEGGIVRQKQRRQITAQFPRKYPVALRIIGKGQLPLQSWLPIGGQSHLRVKLRQGAVALKRQLRGRCAGNMQQAGRDAPRPLGRVKRQVQDLRGVGICGLQQNMALRPGVQPLHIQMRCALAARQGKLGRKARLNRLPQNRRAKHHLLCNDGCDGDRHGQIGQRPRLCGDGGQGGVGLRLWQSFKVNLSRRQIGDLDLAGQKGALAPI